MGTPGLFLDDPEVRLTADAEAGDALERRHDLVAERLECTLVEGTAPLVVTHLHADVVDHATSPFSRSSATARSDFSRPSRPMPRRI